MTRVSNLTMLAIIALAGCGLPETPDRIWVTVPEDAAIAAVAESLQTRGVIGSGDALISYMRMVRTRRYKLVRHFRAHFMDELYDLEEDPGEEHNLLRKKGDPPAVHEELERTLRVWMESLDDPLLEDA